MLKQAPKEKSDYKVWIPLQRDIAGTLLAIDPEGSRALVAPVLLELAKGHRFGIRQEVFRLLAECGAATRPALPALFAGLDPRDLFAPSEARELTPLLSPEDRDLLPAIRRLLGSEWDELNLAKALFRLGQRQEALTLAVHCLQKDFRPDRVEAARWLGQQGRHAESTAPALRQALARAEGSEWAQIIVALRCIGADEANGPQPSALQALGDLLVVCTGVARLDPVSFWAQPKPSGQEHAAVGDAVAVVLNRLPPAVDPVDILVKSLRDPLPEVCLVAALVLARVEPRHPETVPTLRRLLERQPSFFCFAADTLLALGPTAAPVAPLLLPLLRHPDDSVYLAADRVLRRLDPVLAARAWGAVGVADAVPVDLAPLWDDLAAEDACRADLAAWRLAGAGPRTITLLRQRLRPPPVLTPQRVERLIMDLDSEEFDVRQRASAELADGIETAAAALRRTLAADPSLEVRLRIERLLARFSEEQSPEDRQRSGALRVLESIGSPEARDLLRGLSRGDPRLTMTQEAAAALGRLERP